MSVVFVFVDGIGFGRPSVENPFHGMHLDVLGPLGGAEPPRSVAYGRLDPRLGYPGLPQSATGQAVLFTGVDLVGHAGGHFPAQPTRSLGEKIAEYSFLQQARERGLRAAFLNGYDPERAAHLTRVVRGLEPARRLHAPSASTWAALAGGAELRTMTDVAEGRAATFDLTGELIRAYGIEAPRRTVREAARIVAQAAAELDVSLFELFLTDVAGHSRNRDFARQEIEKTDRFLAALFDAIDPRRQTVVVTSDHGNCEDLSTRSHTMADVPLVAYGAQAGRFAHARDLRDVAPAILDAASAEGAQRSSASVGVYAEREGLIPFPS